MSPAAHDGIQPQAARSMVAASSYFWDVSWGNAAPVRVIAGFALEAVAAREVCGAASEIYTGARSTTVCVIPTDFVRMLRHAV